MAKRLVGESLYSANAAVECGELVERTPKRDVVTLVVGIWWKAEQVVVWAGRFLQRNAMWIKSIGTYSLEVFL